MAQQANTIFTLPVLATGVIAAYRGVGFTGLQAGVAGQAILGISKRAALAGDALEVAVLGTATCESGAAIAIGTALAIDAFGRVVPAVANQFIVGYALEAALALGDFVEVVLSR